jgi:hypothetical protein
VLGDLSGPACSNEFYKKNSNKVAKNNSNKVDKNYWNKVARNNSIRGNNIEKCGECCRTL